MPPSTEISDMDGTHGDGSNLSHPLDKIRSNASVIPLARWWKARNQTARSLGKSVGEGLSASKSTEESDP